MLKTFVVSENYTFCSVQIVSPDLKSEDNCTQLKIMSGPRPNLDASQYTTKSSLPSGKVRTGASQSFCFKVRNASSCLNPQSKGLFF
ncbi:hypothetical protein Hanom_Chr07g00632201 [Helianthus anomalus]